MTEPWKNQLYFGDNLTILREHIPDASVDLIYLDPPFNSNATYNVLFAEQSGERSAVQIAAFEDTWHWPKPNTDTGGEFLRCLQGSKGGASCLRLRRPRQPFPKPYHVESRGGCYML